MTRLTGYEIEGLVKDLLTSTYSGEIERKNKAEKIRKVLQDAYMEADEARQLHTMVMDAARERVRLEAEVAALREQLSAANIQVQDVKFLMVPRCARCLEEGVQIPQPAIAIRGGRSWCGTHFGFVEPDQSLRKGGQ